MQKIPHIQARVVFGRWLVNLLFRLLGGWAVSGQDNVPRTGRVIICANHISDADPPAVLASLPRPDFVAMAEAGLFRVPILGPLMRAYGTFPVVRDSADRKALRKAEEVLEAEKALVVFPEGRLSKTGMLQRVQPGAARLALRSGASIVPVGLTGTNLVVPHGKLMPRRAKSSVRVRFGEPIRMEDFSDLPYKEAVIAVTHRLAHELARLTAQPPPDLAQPDAAFSREGSAKNAQPAEA